VTEKSYTVGMIVEHPKRPNWGPGKILAVERSQVVVYFRDVSEGKAGDAQKKFNTDNVELKPLKVQSDPWLDNLPPYKDGRFKTKIVRVTMQEGVQSFLKKFPGGFIDEAYINDPEKGERQYKWDAHLKFVELLGDGQFGTLLSSGNIDELKKRVLAVESKINILSIYEKAAFRDALKDDAAARAYLETLSLLLDAGPKQDACTTYFEAVNRLPAELAKSPVATWPVATVIPYLARPDVFMFLKPNPTKGCADRLHFNLCYDSSPNWLTYQKLLTMCDLLMKQLKQYGARDMIDLQSFIWCIGCN